MKYLNVPIFIASLIIGLIMVYFTMPDMRIIYVYPTPENIGKIQYKDNADNCFNFKQREVPCPKNESDISIIPVQ
jgi:hypothetical protein